MVLVALLSSVHKDKTTKTETYKVNYGAIAWREDKEGKQLWTSSFTAPYSSIAQNDTTLSLTGVYPEDGVIIFHSTKQLKYWGYDMKTGTLLWESAREPDQNYYSTQVNYYKGLLLTTGYGGVCYCLQHYDWSTSMELYCYKHRRRITLWQLPN